MRNRRLLSSSALLLILAVVLAISLGASGVAAQSPESGETVSGIYRGVSPVDRFDVSPPMSSIEVEAPKAGEFYEIPEFDSGLEGPLGPQDVDPLVQSEVGPDVIPGPFVSFDGPSNLAGVSPPDPVGDVGPNHYVAMSNLYWAVYDKTGSLLLGPLPNNSLWAGFGGDCQTDNSGDPIVVYDQFADRWILTQFTASGPTYFNCIAISTSPDPTSTYYRYAVGTGTNFPDYPKYGVWEDAYYISTREFAGSFAGVGAYAIDRAAMIAGNPAPTVISFLAPPGATPYNVGDGLLPSDIDGNTWAPAGSPNYFVGSMDDGGQYGAPIDALTIWEFDADFVTPANSTFTLADTVPVAPFDSQFPCSPGSRDCIPQPDTSNTVDILSYRQRPMWRLAYRNFGTHEALVTNQSVEAAPNMAGVRWYEIRDPGGTPSIFQQGTYAPGVADGIHRWMGSIAMDTFGNMALGYSASAATGTYPSSWYTGRLAGDPLGTMPQGEGSFIDGTGSQTSSARWGDYTSMNVDPVDDCTFWYVNEYVPTTSGAGWRLRIGAFRFPDCGGGGGDPNINVTPLSMSSTQDPDTQQMLPLDIGNTGPADLTWLINELNGTAPEVGLWSDNFDSYATGSQMHGQGGWKGWANDPAAGALTSAVQARSAPNSVDILGASDLVHEYAGATSGQWTYTAWQYVPGNMAELSYFILLNQYDDAGTTNNWSTQVSFDGAANLVTSEFEGLTLPLIKDQWVEIRVEIDLDADSQSIYYDNQLLSTKSWTAGVTGGGSFNIAAVDLFANNATSVYYDDMSLTEVGAGPCDMPVDIPWLTVNPDNGTTPPFGTNTVDVTFDSTGYGPGTYNGDLCVESNDPDPGPGNGTDLVVVPVEMIVTVPEPDPLVCNSAPVAFESGIPTDWTVAVNTGNVYWSTTDDLAACDNGGNQTLGSGEAACADSDQTNVAGDPYDTELWSNSFDLTGYSSVFLQFAGAYNDIGTADMFEVWVWDGGSWTLEASWDADFNEIVVLDLSAYGGLADVAVSFRYSGLGWDWWAQVDDVLLECAGGGQEPDINVDPLFIGSTQDTNTVTNHPLDIENVGTADLDWFIDEDYSMPVPLTPGNGEYAVETVADGGAGASNPAPLSGFEWPEAVLWDNGPLVNCAGCGAGGADESQVQTVLGLTLYGFGHQLPLGYWVADDFSVADAAGWDIDAITFFAYQTGSTTTSTMTDLAWLLYDGDPSAGGTVIASGSGLDMTDWSNIYRALDTASGNTDRPVMYDVANLGGLYLPQGDYWLAWQTDGSLASGPWAPPITINGQTTTGNALQSLDNGGTWAAALDGGTGTAQGLPFIIEGQVSGGGGDLCTMPSDIPWASVTPDNGTTAPGATDTVDVTFDATGLLAGTYTGVLCVNSNDPDPGTGNGTELVIVELEMVVETPTDVNLSNFSGDTNAAVLPMLVAMVAALVAGFGLVLRRRSLTE